MFEFFIELTEINTLYAIYTGIILGLALKYYWSLNCDSWDQTTPTTYTSERKLLSPKIILKNFKNQLNLLYNWIIQIVRRKESTSDEVDSMVSF